MDNSSLLVLLPNELLSHILQYSVSDKDEASSIRTLQALACSCSFFHGYLHTELLRLTARHRQILEDKDRVYVTSKRSNSLALCRLSFHFHSLFPLQKMSLLFPVVKDVKCESLDIVAVDERGNYLPKICTASRWKDLDLQFCGYDNRLYLNGFHGLPPNQHVYSVCVRSTTFSLSCNPIYITSNGDIFSCNMSSLSPISFVTINPDISLSDKDVNVLLEWYTHLHGDSNKTFLVRYGKKYFSNHLSIVHCIAAHRMIPFLPGTRLKRKMDWSQNVDKRFRRIGCKMGKVNSIAKIRKIEKMLTRMEMEVG